MSVYVRVKCYTAEYQTGAAIKSNYEEVSVVYDLTVKFEIKSAWRLNLELEY